MSASARLCAKWIAHYAIRISVRFLAFYREDR